MQFIQHNNVFKTSVKPSWTFHLMLNIFILSIHFKFEHIFTIKYIPMLYQLLAKIYSKTFAKIVISFRQRSLYTSFLHSFLYWTKWEKKRIFTLQNALLLLRKLVISQLQIDFNIVAIEAKCYLQKGEMRHDVWYLDSINHLVKPKSKN